MYDFLKYVLWELKNSIGLVILAGIAALIVLGIAYAIHRKKHKGSRKFPWGKALLWLVFAGYVAVVLYATVLRGGTGYRAWNLHLFRAWREAWNNYSVKNWANVLLNVAMFVPLGVLLPLLAKCFRKWYWTIPIGFLASLSIELIQLAIGIGICDVDDLFTNTLGSVIGFLLIMAILSVFKEKGSRLKPCLVYGSLFLVVIAFICSIFVSYELQEYGNLPMAPAYRNNTRNTEWILSCELPAVDSKLPVYRAQNRSLQDCDAFAEAIAELDGTAVDMVSYYQDFAYYMLYTEGSGSGVLQVSYYDESYTYSLAGSGFGVATKVADRETIEAALSRYPVIIPVYAEFSVDEDNWHIFTVDKYIDGAKMFDGSLRCQYLEDDTLRKIENNLLSYNYHDVVSVISPSEAYQALCSGYFYDEGYFEHKNPAKVMVLSCDLEYEIDTKGFYQPVYLFTVEAVDGSYADAILIPAVK